MTSDPTSEVIRGRNSKNRYFTHLEGKTLLSTINQRLFEAIEAVEAVEAMEAVKVMDSVEATEVVKTTVTEAVWAMEARKIEV